MAKWLREHIRIILIVYIVGGAVMVLAGIVMWVISSRFGLYPPSGPFLLLVGLVQFSVGIWLYKRKGKGILG